VWLDGPHGDFVPSSHGGDHAGLVLVAGGVGLTPIMSILRAHAAHGDPRPHRLLLAERPGEALFASELDVLARRLDLVVTRTEGRRLDTGMLADALPTAVAADHEYFVCGPPRLVVAALAVLVALAVPSHRVHTEQFA
jgi:ferredoxin-NADP reductase